MFKPRLIYYISERRGEAFDLGGTREGRDRDAGDRPGRRREHRDPPSGKTKFVLNRNRFEIWKNFSVIWSVIWKSIA